MWKWNASKRAEKSYSGEKEDSNRKRLIKSCYIKLSRLWPGLRGPAQHSPQKAGTEALTTFYHVLIHHHRQIFPPTRPKMLYTTEVAEATFPLAASFLAETQDAGLGELFHNIWHWSLGFRWFKTEIALLGLVVKPALGMAVIMWGTASLWCRWGAPWTCEIYHRKMTHPIAYGLCVHVVCLLTDDSLMPPQPTLVFKRGHLSMWSSPTDVSSCWLKSPWY